MAVFDVALHAERVVSYHCFLPVGLSIPKYMNYIGKQNFITTTYIVVLGVIVISCNLV